MLACTRKERLIARSGSPHLARELDGFLEHLVREVQDPDYRALLHDLGKIREFSYGAEIGLSDEGRLVGHVALGQRLIEERAGGLAPDKRLALIHCVLTHHGADAVPGRRFGSPEAVALHRLNALEATVKGALEHGLNRLGRWRL